MPTYLIRFLARCMPPLGIVTGAATALLPLPPPRRSSRSYDSVYYTFVQTCAREGGGRRERVVGRHSRGYTRLIYLRVDTKAQDGSLLPLRLPYSRVEPRRWHPRASIAGSQIAFSPVAGGLRRARSRNIVLRTRIALIKKSK
ncbi:hypothetical protein X777_15908 [Ooceraea biroi]|uniref:Uncharacterized protein n=1 Tax=Ooceraea biroi TaxID=2015173 RepID=A0A026WT76_OOCBI|nr:hypothetical protein X777_15908 [Ooceraea biroi]